MDITTKGCLVLFCGLLSGCSGTTVDPAAHETAHLVAVEGRDLHGLVGLTLSKVVVEARSRDQVPIKGVQVAWTIIGPIHCLPQCSNSGAAIQPGMNVTDADGRASATPQLGDVPGVYYVIPSVANATASIRADTFHLVAVKEATQ